MSSDQSTDFLPRASGPTQEHAYRSGPRIVRLETVVPHDAMPGLLALRIHTDAGTVGGVPVIGHGETYYIPTAAAAVIHDFFAPRLLGSSATAIESHWRFLYERMTAFGGWGAELRALSAVDLALWDIFGQLQQLPVWRLLGGPVRDAVPVYNSSGGPSYGRTNRRIPAASGWPGHGDPGQPGPLEDNWASMNQPEELAEELLELGYHGMKLWSFDACYRRSGGQYVSAADLREGLAPFERIRDKVGDRIEVMLDGHGFFTMAAAVRIADAMAPIKPLWLEDILRPDSLQAMTEFRSRISVPVAVSEMLVSADSYRQILNSGAADYAMIDPTWVGGISAAVKLVDQAQICNIPALMHDCTGPMTLLAGVNVAAARTGVAFQETVRAHLATLYPLLIDEQIQVQQGGLPLPGRAGLGARWLPELFDSSHPGYRCSDLNSR
ncbi:MAG TPA: mandelate racemase/muconate lactonizing enzyme family protein [Planctomycetaceae bacterium]|nr:mandelate racemase/muconate lactonizing enzyme family protein [Planctomycetaceae bacterium]